MKPTVKSGGSEICWARRALDRLGHERPKRAALPEGRENKIKKLEARSAAIRRRFQIPCPTKYGEKEADKDRDRLLEFAELRDNGTALTEAQKAEQAHLQARLDVFNASPEAIARRRRQALEDAERRFKMSRLTGDFPAAPLSRKQRNELELLRSLYPKPARNLSQLDGDGFEMSHYHPFRNELPAPDGKFYPRHSKLRPAAAADDHLVPKGHGSPISSVIPRNAPATDPSQSVEPPL